MCAGAYLTAEALKLKEIKGLFPSKRCFSTEEPSCFLLQSFGIVENLQRSLHLMGGSTGEMSSGILELTGALVL